MVDLMRLPMKYLQHSTVLNTQKRALSLYEEFRTFAFKGNVIDLAVGVIIGAAFGKLVDSLVKHLMLPLIGALIPGEAGYLEWKWVINGKEVPYGLFLGEAINFLIVALALFIFAVKFLDWIRARERKVALSPPPPTKEEVLLTEIRDLLKQQSAPVIAPAVTANMNGKD